MSQMTSYVFIVIRVFFIIWMVTTTKSNMLNEVTHSCMFLNGVNHLLLCLLILFLSLSFVAQFSNIFHLPMKIVCR